MPSLPYKFLKNFRATYPPSTGRGSEPIRGGQVRVHDMDWFPSTTYADPEYLTANAWPVVLDTEGSANIYVRSGEYRISILDSRGVVYATYEIRL